MINKNNDSDEFDLDFSKKNSRGNPPPAKRAPRPAPPAKSSPPPHYASTYKPRQTHNPPRGKNKKKSDKYRPPAETILIYAIVAVVIVIICIVVFLMMFDSSKDSEGGTVDSESEYQISGDESDIESKIESEPESDDTGDWEFISDEDIDDSVSTVYSNEFFDNDLFIGDSIFTGLYLYGILDSKNVVASIGNTAYGALYNILNDYDGTAVDYAEFMQPTHINIMLGSNALYTNVSYTNLISSYKSLINALKEACPNSRICIISVPPITADSYAAESAGITKEIIDTANSYIKTMCEELDVRYFDLNSRLSNENGYFKEGYAEVDGLHFKIAAYNTLLYGLCEIWS